MSVQRLDATRFLTDQLNDELVVAALGNPAYDLYLSGDRPGNYYMWGAMGLASSVGLGLALAAPGKRVVALDGDGCVLMNLGALATVGQERPQNLVHIVWDNKGYDLTGGQASATADHTDLVAVAKGAGIEKSVFVETEVEFQKLVPRILSEPGPWFVLVATGPTPKDRKKPVVELRRRFLDIDMTIDSALS